MRYDTEYIFADPIDIELNLLTDFDIDNYIFLYKKDPFEIKVVLKAEARYAIDRDGIIKIIAKKYDELMLNDYVVVTTKDRRKEG